MRTQARGLAQAIADTVVERTTPRRPFWRGLAAADGESLGPPWPDIVVSCGRRSVGAALGVRKASGGRTLAVHVQDPRSRAAAFDLIIAMAHDRIAPGRNVIKVATALHDLTPENLEAAGRQWADRFAPLGRPLIGVVVGGDLRGRPFTIADTQRLIAGLRSLRAGVGGGLAITPSRRTPLAVRALLAAEVAEDPRAYLWNLEGDNPYRAILALSDRVVLTSDSVSMVSEALASPRPVEVLDLGFARHAGFVQELVDRNLVRRFEGDPALPRTSGPINATIEAAEAVRALLQTRTGVVGKAS